MNTPRLTRWVYYHSDLWAALVESGWYSMKTEWYKNGDRLVLMGRD